MPVCWRGVRLAAWLSAAQQAPDGALNVQGSVGTNVVVRCALMCSCKRGQSQRCISGLKAFCKYELANMRFYWIIKATLGVVISPAT